MQNLSRLRDYVGRGVGEEEEFAFRSMGFLV
jgi:hypothetical protein